MVAPLNRLLKPLTSLFCAHSSSKNSHYHKLLYLFYGLVNTINSWKTGLERAISETNFC